MASSLLRRGTEARDNLAASIGTRGEEGSGPPISFFWQDQPVPPWLQVGGATPHTVEVGPPPSADPQHAGAQAPDLLYAKAHSQRAEEHGAQARPHLHHCVRVPHQQPPPPPLPGPPLLLRRLRPRALSSEASLAQERRLIHADGAEGLPGLVEGKPSGASYSLHSSLHVALGLGQPLQQCAKGAVGLGQRIRSRLLDAQGAERQPADVGGIGLVDGAEQRPQGAHRPALVLAGRGDQAG
mmetsp:Transcript_94661/g.276763  ORF Transcript_94661/g.276763 Transcript_94661/m.276763 type:complete len:240 (-) Transcript_94661:1972-2691(-)